MIRLCVFNMSGNLGNVISKYSLAPETSLINVFHKKGIILHHSLLNNINNDKLVTINNIMNDEYIKNAWYHRYGHYPNYGNTLKLYEEYMINQLKGVDNIEILPGINKCIKTLGDNNISTGVISLYNKPITLSIRDKLIENNILIDKYVSTGCVYEPSKAIMIKYIMDSIALTDRKKVLVIENNPDGVKESNNLGFTTVGISGYRWELRDKLICAGATYTSDTLDLISIIKNNEKK